jgi:hypothetical protein
LKRKFDKSALPELPNRGDYGIFEKEAKIIEYRKEALSRYLSQILNDGKQQNHPFLLEFIR